MCNSYTSKSSLSWIYRQLCTVNPPRYRETETDLSVHIIEIGIFVSSGPRELSIIKRFLYYEGVRIRKGLTVLTLYFASFILQLFEILYHSCTSGDQTSTFW